MSYGENSQSISAISGNERSEGTNAIWQMFAKYRMEQAENVEVPTKNHPNSVFVFSVGGGFRD